MSTNELAGFLQTFTDQPLVPAVIIASIAGVFLLRYLNRLGKKPAKPRPQQRQSKRKKR
jgi:hypothetical protein